MKIFVVFSLVCLAAIVLPDATAAKKYYLQTSAKVNWWTAAQTCRQKGLQLATINSASEETAIEAEITKAGLSLEYFWTSGTDQAAETKFVWFSTGQPFGYTKWSIGEPNNLNTENCVHIWNINSVFGWNDLNCASTMYYICEDVPC